MENIFVVYNIKKCSSSGEFTFLKIFSNFFKKRKLFQKEKKEMCIKFEILSSKQ